MSSRKHVGQLAPAILLVALLIVPAYSLITEDIDIIWTIPGGTAFSPFGASVASGDVNGDGVPDLVVASDTYDYSQAPLPLRGTINIYYGNNVGETLPDLVLRSPVWKGSNPPYLACGDLNGDGYADIAVGEDMADDGYGICAVWMGGNPPDTAPYCVIHGRNWWLEAYLGRSVSVGDVNGDGCDDLAVGAYYTAERPGEYGTGRVYVYHGGPGFDTLPDVVLKGGHDDQPEGFGIGVSAEGDFDHDGFHDLYIGAFQYGGFNGAGRVYVFYGGNPMDTAYDMAMSGEGSHQWLGFDKPGALSAQGIFDYAVEGNELWPNGGGSNRGKVYIHEGGRPMDSIPDIAILGPQDPSGLGVSAQSAGDVTGDANDDLLAGAPDVHPPRTAGAAYLWETGAHFDTVPDAWMLGESEWQLVGFETSTAGDLDGDGRSEFTVSNYPGDEPTYVWVCKYTGLGVQEEEAIGVNARALRVWPSVVNRQLNLAGWNRAVLLDASGRKVLDLRLGSNDVRALAPGVYFVREAQTQAQAQAVRKIVLTE